MINQEIANLLDQQIKVFQSLKNISVVEEKQGRVDGKIIGTGQVDYTQGATAYTLSINEKEFELIDMPGIEGRERLYERIISDSLERSHAIFYVNGSGKKIEHNTLEKIKNYMHDKTSLYAIINVHCKPKKERILGIDKSYSEELFFEFEKNQEIAEQIEEELISFLGDNFKGIFLVNGLLSFSALATTKSGKSSIVIENEKTLELDQKKYMKEYLQNTELMALDSGIYSIKEIIDQKIEFFDEEIYEENVNKLKNRIFEMIEKLKELRNKEKIKINEFIKIYDGFQENCYNAKEEFIKNVRYAPSNSIEEIFADLSEELFELIDGDMKKISDRINYFFVSKNDEIMDNIQEGIYNKIEVAQKEYEETIENAFEKLLNGFEKETVNFKLSLNEKYTTPNYKFENFLEYEVKGLKEHLGKVEKVAKLAFDGFSTGKIVLGVIATIIGVALEVWSYSISRIKKKNLLKESLHKEINKLAEGICTEINARINNLKYEEKINDSYQETCSFIKAQKNNLFDVDNNLEAIINELNMEYRSII